MVQLQQIQIKDHKIFISTGTLSQTVNVCNSDNRRGEYDWIVRLFPPDFVEKNDIERQGSINGLIEWLEKKRHGLIEHQPHKEEMTENDIQVADAITEKPLSHNSIWVERAMKITEICIDELVREFLEIPYLHRVEHSIHTRLCAILNSQPHFARLFPLAESGMLTQPIHKEWPEPIPRPEKGNRRGNFDLAILSPVSLSKCSLKDFSTGKLVPPIAIEIGLNYGEGHLAADAEKLLNSNIQHGYLVHLVRELSYDLTIDKTIEKLQKEITIRIAFARFERGKKYLKLLDDKKIQEV